MLFMFCLCSGERVHGHEWPMKQPRKKTESGGRSAFAQHLDAALMAAI